VLKIGVHEIDRLHFLDVGTGGKSLFGAGEDDCADLAVRIESPESFRQFLKHLAVQRIERLRTIKTNEAHAAARLNDDRFIGHEFELLHQRLAGWRAKWTGRTSFSSIHCWQEAQKKVERPDCTARSTKPLRAGFRQGSPSRP